MIRTTGSVGSDGKTIIWFFIISYSQYGYCMPPVEKHLNRKGAVTYFYKMIQREKKIWLKNHTSSDNPVNVPIDVNTVVSD